MRSSYQIAISFSEEVLFLHALQKPFAAELVKTVGLLYSKLVAVLPRVPQLSKRFPRNGPKLKRPDRALR
jgi:hypothetical protein